ncbi:MAG: flagellar hook-length control protein FliK [Phycisphaerales bacterium]|nr:MAG: flagellar hook-length control protein FliK [Phycisphaerales bacterium]
MNAEAGRPRVAGERKQSILQDPQAAGTRVNAEQQPPRNGQPSAHSADVNPPQAVFHENSQQPAVVGPQPEPAYATKAPAGAPPGNTATLSEQIQESVATALRQADRRITVRLNPPELGKVFIRFHRDKEQITGLLEVTRAQTRTEIQQALPQILRTLEDSGVQIKRIEVSLESEQQQSSSGDRTAAEQHGAPYEQGTPTNSYDWEPDGFPGDRPSGKLNTGFTGLGQPVLTDESVNVLV